MQQGLARRCDGDEGDGDVVLERGGGEAQRVPVLRARREYDGAIAAQRRGGELKRAPARAHRSADDDTIGPQATTRPAQRGAVARTRRGDNRVVVLEHTGGVLEERSLRYDGGACDLALREEGGACAAGQQVHRRAVLRHGAQRDVLVASEAPARVL